MDREFIVSPLEPSVHVGRRQFDEMLADLATIKNDLHHLHKDVSILSKILMEDATLSLTSRMAVNENKIQQFQQHFEQSEDQAVMVKVAVATSVFGVLTSVVVAIVEFWGRK